MWTCERVNMTLVFFIQGLTCLLFTLNPKPCTNAMDILHDCLQKVSLNKYVTSAQMLIEPAMWQFVIFFLTWILGPFRRFPIVQLMQVPQLWTRISRLHLKAPLHVDSFKAATSPATTPPSAVDAEYLFFTDVAAKCFAELGRRSRPCCNCVQQLDCVVSNNKCIRTRFAINVSTPLATFSHLEQVAHRSVLACWWRVACVWRVTCFKLMHADFQQEPRRPSIRVRVSLRCCNVRTVQRIPLTIYMQPRAQLQERSEFQVHTSSPCVMTAHLANLFAESSHENV